MLNTKKSRIGIRPALLFEIGFKISLFLEPYLSDGTDGSFAKLAASSSSVGM